METIDEEMHAAGKDDLKEDLLEGHQAIGRSCRQHLDGYDLNEYLANAATHKTIEENIEASPRKEFIYVNDDGAVVAIRIDQWKAVY